MKAPRAPASLVPVRKSTPKALLVTLGFLVPGAPLLVTSCSAVLGLTEPILMEDDAQGDGSGGGDAAPTGPETSAPVEAGSGDGESPPTARCDSGCAGRAGPCGVKAGPICIDAIEVTVGDFRAFLEATAGTTVDVGAPCSPLEIEPRALPTQEDLPVTHVTFCEARAFCAWAGKELCGKLTGGTLDDGASLASTAWGYACSGGTTDKMRLLSDGGCHIDAGGPRPASELCEGGFRGLFDMAGNVAEWIDQPATTDAGPIASLVGGSFFTKEVVDCRTKGTGYLGNRFKDVGFRCCAP